MSSLVAYETDGSVATITIDDGKVNAFSIPMLQAIHRALDRAEHDEAVVVLAGRAGCFSAGFDLQVIGAGGPDLTQMLRLGATLAERLLSFPRPVVVACTGHAYPAGAFLLLAADVRIGTAGPFRIGLNEVRIGLTVPWFAIELARHRLQPDSFDRIVTAAMYEPEQAVVAGFLDRVVDAGDLRAASVAAAAELVQLDGRAHAATKMRVRGAALAAVRAAIAAELAPA